ncbi:hypothetical protein PRIPAC_70636 [Pristionchus pacificus]|uniref:Uncharacterized protein n=1 Tax=Pristionchus pacificus TaxID=54126 RepID=A0A2A6C1H7_PRIPA|nr:hypothetical protein PRIPAC_70636 [Pristionchus pacificus]|eukprot:PDM72024.1 hypothetical protein PRIPAC_38431 [Pristionchus pacificus]
MFFNGDSLQVYNESLLVTLTVQRYAHALLHGTPVEKVPELFKSESAGLFYHAFLAYMRKDRISFDAFFLHFPAIFVFDNVWTLNKESASKIPSVSRANCVPERDTTRIYVDRSKLFSGVGVVHANNIAKIKIQSSECLRKGMPYFVSVPIDIVDDRAKYPIGAKVIRLYNDEKDTVQGTIIRLETEQNLMEKEECLIDLSDNDDITATVVKETKTMDETRDNSIVRTLDIRATIAEREHKRQEDMLRLANDGIEVHEMGQQVLNLFPYGYDDYLEYLEKRPFLFDVQQRENDGAVIIKSRRASDGRSISKLEAILMCTAANESLPEEDRFNFDDLKGRRS